MNKQQYKTLKIILTDKQYNYLLNHLSNEVSVEVYVQGLIVNIIEACQLESGKDMRN